MFRYIFLCVCFCTLCSALTNKDSRENKSEKALLSKHFIKQELKHECTGKEEMNIAEIKKLCYYKDASNSVYDVQKLQESLNNNVGSKMKTLSAEQACALTKNSYEQSVHPVEVTFYKGLYYVFVLHKNVNGDGIWLYLSQDGKKPKTRLLLSENEGDAGGAIHSYTTFKHDTLYYKYDFIYRDIGDLITNSELEKQGKPRKLVRVERAIMNKAYIVLPTAAFRIVAADSTSTTGQE